jgi:branched-chain amino acid transport system substrate-binding protein
LASSRSLRLIAPCLAPALFATLLLGCHRDGGGPVRIGVAGSFSDPIGIPMQLAAELAAGEINAAGGIGGRPLELVVRDDYADPDSAVFIASDLYDSDVAAVVGHLFSGTTLAAAPVYNGGDNPVAAISPSSSSPEVSSAGDHTFRVCPSDLAHGAVLAEWVRQTLNLERGAVLYLNDQYGRGIRQTFVEHFVRLGGRLESVDPYLGDRPDVGPYLDRMARNRNIQFLVVAGNRGEAEEVLRQARRRGITVPIVGGDGLEGIEAAGALAEGVYLTSAYFPTISTGANRKFVEAYRRKYPGAGMPNQPAAATYDAIYLLSQVIARAGTDRQAVRRALAGVGSETPPFEGVTGLVAFDAVGDVPAQNVYVGRVHAGAIQVANSSTEMAQGPQP